MKKSLFVLGVAVAALASCTNEEVVDIADSNAIKFSDAFVGKAVRSSVVPITTAGIDKFYVMGTKANTSFFDNVEVYKQNGMWGYDALKQWETASYAFSAYSNGGEKISTGVTFTAADGLKIADYVVDNSAKKDLIMSVSGTNLDAANTPIEYTFKHALSMIKFTLNSSLGNNTVTISNLTMKAIKTTGDATLANSTSNVTWTVDNTPTENFASDEFTTTQGTPGASDEFVVIPQNGSNLEVTLTAKLTDADGTEVTIVLTASIASYDWQAGLRYNYTATITGTDMNLIEFDDPTVDDWPIYTNGNMDIQ